MSKDVDHLSTSDEFEYPPFPPPKLRRTPPSDSYIHFAVQHNNIAAANLLLKYNFDEIDEPRRYGHTPLHQAIQLKYEDMAEFLLSRGANANSMSVSPSCRGFGYDDWSVGESPLHLSISLQLDKVTHLLMENGANPFQEGVLRGSVTDENRITPLELSTLLGKQIPSQYIARNFNVEQFIPILDICLLQNNAPRLNLLLDSIPIQSLKEIIDFIPEHVQKIVSLSNLLKEYRSISHIPYSTDLSEFIGIIQVYSFFMSPNNMHPLQTLDERFLDKIQTHIELLNDMCESLNQRILQIKNEQTQLINAKSAPFLYELIPKFTSINETEFVTIGSAIVEWQMPNELIVNILSYLIPAQSITDIFYLRKTVTPVITSLPVTIKRTRDDHDE